MLNVQCRLCSSKTALISLFNGKSRGHRDYIRRLIYVTTGIKFQKNDAWKYICFPCTVQIYNFYIFRARSIEKEKELQATTIENVKVKSNKIEIPDVDDITLPNIEKLKETLAPWLNSKQKCCSTENNESIENTGEKNIDKHNENITNNVGPEMVENSTQCESVVSFDKENQIQPCVNEIFTQTSKIQTRFVQIQCDLIKRNKKIAKKASKDSSTQTKATNRKESVYIQCELLKTSRKTSNFNNRESAKQTDLNNIDHKFVKSYQKTSKITSDSTNRSEIKRSKKYAETVKRCNKESSTQTKSDNVSCSNVLVQTDDHKGLEKNSRDSTTQTKLKYQGQSFESHNYEQCQEIDIKDTLKLGLLNVKQETESPKKLSSMKSMIEHPKKLYTLLESPKKISHMKSLTGSPKKLPLMNYLSNNVDGTNSDILVSPNSCVSPRSSGLLTVKNKIQNVIICEQCDKTIYSKTEYKLHKEIHMICNLCKKKFTSVRKTKLHTAAECKVQKLIKTEPVVPLIRLENSRDVQKRYPSNLKELIELRGEKIKNEKDAKRMFRLRSRSISNFDNFCSNSISNVDNFCNNCTNFTYFSILSGISVGVDKSVQTNFLLDKQLNKTPLEYFCEKLCLKRSFKDLDNCIPTKKLKSF